MATNTKQPPPPASNGVITAPVGNRKKQKRRQKQAMKAAAQTNVPESHPEDHADPGYDDDDGLGLEEDEEDYSDAENDHYDEQMSPQPPPVNGMHPPPISKSKKKNKKKKSMSGGVDTHAHYDPGMLPPLPPTGALSPSGGMRPSMRGGPSSENIWNVSTAQERQNIKEFWLSLSEEERKSLLKIEKEAVLKKMKQQQKHSCSCTVCGRKRTAIEEELEVLYEGYYEELEQYAHHDHPPLPNADGMMPDPLQHRRQHPLAFHPPSPPPMPHHKTSHLHEHLDEEDYSDEEEEEYSDDEEDEEDDEEEYSDEEPEPEPLPPHGRPPVQDFFSFGSQLTVKGILTPWVEKLRAGLKGNADNLLTVADDLLKNDGRKFIEMMEQLAERRMQRENRSHYESEHHAGYPPDDGAYSQDDQLAAGEEYDDEEASYDSQDEYDDEMEDEDEMGGLTEEQRMQEGRRMFQIFAARMFEQRVLQAYKEKVAEERQAKLLAELEDEKSLEAQREAKKQRDAQKKKEKKKQQQQQKAEEKAKRDAEKAAEEAKLKEAEEKKLEEQRRRKEEQRRKREEEKKKQEEEKARKESEKQRKLQEEQQRREDAERKAREAKAAEKARKDEARKREREEREAREKEARERRAHEESQKKERETRAGPDKESKDREKSTQQTAHPPQITKRPSQPGMVAIPGVYPKQTQSGISSPHPQIATPAVPKAPTPAKQRHASHQASQASSPKQTQSQLSSAPSKSTSPGSSGHHQASYQPKTILQKAGNQQQPVGQQTHNSLPTPSPLHQHPMQAPPGMPHPQQLPTPFGAIPHIGYPGFPGSHGPFTPGGMPQRGPMPMFPPQGPPPIGMPNRMSFPGMNGMPTPPGMMAPQGRPFPSFDAGSQPPPGFGQPLPHQNSHVSPIGQSPSGLGNGSGMPGHSRQHSSDKERFESAANQPIGRPPAPIQRPGSVKPGGLDRNANSSDVEDLSKHLGSSALLDDADEPLPTNPADNRRHSNLAPGSRNISVPTAGLGQLAGFGPPGGAFGTPSSTWGTPSIPFGSSPGLGQPGWGSLPNQGLNGWGHNGNAFGVNGFGSMGPGPLHRGPAPMSRPLTIRQNVCNACKQLTIANRDQGDGFHDVQILLRQIEANRPMLDSPPSLKEIEEICETEGDAQNGGGLLHVRQNDTGDGFSVKWEPDAGTPDQGRGHGGLGEIGSPLPGKILPATGGGHFGFGAPGMGRGAHSLTGSLQPLGPPRAD